MKQERSKVKSDILLRVRLLYVLFILAGAIVLARLVWVQLFSAEVAYNADRLASRIFTEEVIPAQRGSILSRDGEPLATSIFRYQAAFDFASPGLDSLKTFREQADSLAKLLAAFFRDKPASAYAKRFREEHARRYRLVNPRDTSCLRSEGWISRMMDRMRGEEYVKRRIYDTIRDHTPVNIFPREVDFAEWETLRRYPLLNWNMGMVYRLIERDERIYPQGELARRTIGLTGDKGNYGIEEAYREELAGRDGKALRQRIARGFYGRVAGGGHEEPVDGYDIVTTLDLDLQDVADKALRRQLEAQNALWGTTIVMEVHTGEILAMVNLGRNADGSFAERENYALGRSMEPGSTFKLATMLTLLDDARMPVSTVYDTHNGDPVTVGPARNIRDSHRGDREIDFRRAVASSSNVYFAKAIWDRYGSTDGLLYAPQRIAADPAYRETLALFERRGMAVQYRIAQLLAAPTLRLFGLAELLAEAVREKPAARSGTETETPELFVENGRWGYRTAERVVVAPLYDSGFDFTEGLAAVQLGGTWHYIDTAGRTLLSCPGCAAVKPFRGGKAQVVHDGERQEIVHPLKTPRYQ